MPASFSFLSTIDKACQVICDRKNLNLYPNLKPLEPIIIESSLSGVFRVILIIVAIYIVSSYLLRLLLPVIVRNTIRGFQHDIRDNTHDMHHTKKSKEGDITIEYLRKQNNTTSKDEDEYVDYEEVK